MIDTENPVFDPQPMTDEELMDLAIRQAEENTPTNPWVPRVGCVIATPDDVVIATNRGRDDHAEKRALEEAARQRIDLTTATVYTTLEPCTHHARRQPGDSCSERLIAARVTRVIVGSLDPNQDVCGRGILMLQRAGIQVSLFAPEKTARVHHINREFIRTHETLGIRIIEPSSKPARVRVSDEFMIRGTLLNMPEHGEVYTLVGNTSQRWWLQSKPMRFDRETRTWESSISLTYPGHYRIVIVRANPLAQSLLSYYEDISRMSKRLRERTAILRDARDPQTGAGDDVLMDLLNGIDRGLPLPSPLPKGLDAQDWLDVEVS
jgi:pyrimidine deaminase RibD-like protein